MVRKCVKDGVFSPPHLGSNKKFHAEDAEWEVGIKNCVEGTENGEL